MKTNRRVKISCLLIGMVVMILLCPTVSAGIDGDWIVGGNNLGSTGSTGVLGTTSGDHVSIVAGGTQGIIIDGVTNPGFVGIGMASGLPINQLDVGGSKANVAIGIAYAGITAAPQNGMLIQGSSGTVNPPTGGVGIGVPANTQTGFPAGQLHVDWPDPQISANNIVEVCRIGVSEPTATVGSNNAIAIGVYGITGEPVIQAFDQINQNPSEPEGVTLYINPNPGFQTDTVADTILNLNGGGVGIGVIPTCALDVNGDTYLRGKLYDSNGYAGASNRVLTSTGTGTAWSTAVDYDWVINGNDMYSAPPGVVSIGTSTPNSNYKFQVDTNLLTAGTFTTTSQAQFPHVVHAEWTGTGPGLLNTWPTGVYGEGICPIYDGEDRMADRGTGGIFLGGQIGVEGYVVPTGDSSSSIEFVGIYGESSLPSGTINARAIGVYGYADAGSNAVNIGVYGKAPTQYGSWAGFFEGPVHIGDSNNNGDVGIGVPLGTPPASRLEVRGKITSTGLITNGPVTGTGFAGWDTDNTDDLTTSTTFGGDVSGTYNNLQLGTDSVGQNEIAQDSVGNNELKNIVGLSPGTYGSGNNVAVITVNADGRITSASDRTESDPQVGSITTNYVPKWDGSKLITGTISDNGNIGINEPTPLGKLHVKSGDSGVSVASSSADDLIIESNTPTGISILTSAKGSIFFGTSSDNDQGGFEYTEGINPMTTQLQFRVDGNDYFGMFGDGRFQPLYPYDKACDLGQPDLAWDDVYYDDLHNQGAPDWSDFNVLDHMRAISPGPKPAGSYDDVKLELNRSELDPGTLPLELTNYYHLKYNYDQGLSDINPDEITSQELAICTNAMASWNYQAIHDLNNEVDDLRAEIEELNQRIEATENADL